ncbi:MAG: TlpA family protein disulfide reductase, partial [bacterium]
MRRLAALALLCGLVACSSASPPTADGGATSSGQADTSSGSGAASASPSAYPSASPSAPASSPAAAEPYVGPAFSAPTLDGGFLSDADVAGRPTVMWFWAPWCGVC